MSIPSLLSTLLTLSSSLHKRSATGAKRAQFRKKRVHELGRQAANTRLGQKRVRTVRVRGGNLKYRALRLDSGNFAWGSEHCTRKTRLIGVVYNASNNELVRTNTLVKGAVIQIDAHPFRQWYEAHYGQPVTRKGRKEGEQQTEEVKKSRSVTAKQDERKKTGKIDPLLESQFAAGRLYAMINSRPGQSGRCDGVVSLFRTNFRAFLTIFRSSKARNSSSTFVSSVLVRRPKNCITYVRMNTFHILGSTKL